MDLAIAGKWALVCGASKGLGFGCAKALAQEGVNLVINARRAEAQAADMAKTPDSAARAFFQQLPPQGSAGQARQALLASGPEAEKLARSVWGRTGIPPELEAALLARFEQHLTVLQIPARTNLGQLGDLDLAKARKGDFLFGAAFGVTPEIVLGLVLGVAY